MRAALCILAAAALAPAAEAQGPADAGATGLRRLFQSMGPRETVLATFTEWRWFGFRREPVVLEGEIRVDPARGLSLRYVRPDERVMVVDASGVLLRDPRGRQRALPNDRRAAAMEHALLAVLRFDADAIDRSFRVHLEAAAETWKLTLDPLDPDVAKTLGTLVIEGSGGAVARLEFFRSSSQRVEIRVTGSQRGVVFSPADAARFFR